jgi:tetratricopeptide (TPR) repeat protein
MAFARLRTSLFVAVILSLATLAFSQTDPATRIKQLVGKLSAAQTDEERQVLLGPEKDITTPDLIAGLIPGGDQIRAKGDLDGAMQLARFTLALAERIDDRAGVARVLFQVGAVHFSRAGYDQALEYYRKSLPLMEEAKYQSAVGSVLTAMGQVHRVQGDLDTATELYARALALSQAEGDKMGVANTLNSMGIIHRAQGNTRMALESYQKALALFQELEFDTGVAGMVDNIGNLYLQQNQYAR